MIQVLMHDINVKQTELFSLHQKIDNLLQIYANLNSDFDAELNADVNFQNEEYIKFLVKRRMHITNNIEEFKKREKSIVDAIKFSFHEKEKLKIFMKSKK